MYSRKFIGTAPQGITQTNFLRPTTLNSWSIDFIRTKTRNHFPRPNEAKRIKRHGFWTRMATKEGRRILQRRILKGRYVLSH